MTTLRCLCALCFAVVNLTAGCLITVKGVGDVRIGMTVPQVRLALHGATLQPVENSEHMAIFAVIRDGARVMDLYPDVDEPRKDRTKIELIRVYDAQCATAEGVHPGMPLDAVEKQFGKLLRIERTESESAENAGFEKQPSWIDVQVGKGETGVYPSHKRCTATYKPKATVQSLWVSHPRTSIRFFKDDSECNVPETR